MFNKKVKIKKKKPTHLYILSDGEKVKIGVTSDIDTRIKSLQTGNPKKIVLLYIEERTNPTKAETYLHRCFTKQREEGEWFHGLTVEQIRSRLMIFFDQDE